MEQTNKFECGVKVKKVSKEKFESGLMYNTVKSVSNDTVSFFEDDVTLNKSEIVVVNGFEYAHKVEKYSLDGLVRRLTYNAYDPSKKDNPIAATIKGKLVRKLLDDIKGGKVNGQAMLLFAMGL